MGIRVSRKGAKGKDREGENYFDSDTDSDSDTEYDERTMNIKPPDSRLQTPDSGLTKHLHFDCTYGISGDMVLGALVDLGVPLDAIRDAVAKLPIGKVELRAEQVNRQGINGTQIHVEVDEEKKASRHLGDVLKIVESAGLPPRATARATEAYRLLAAAEARVHGSTPEKIHFHEVGAKDAIVDIAGAMVGVEWLGAESFSSTPVSTGSGTIECLHGVLPIPAPATAELLRGIPQQVGPVGGELATPTGVAILSVLLGETPQTQPVLTAERNGYGAGSRAIEGHANLLRLMLCEAPEFTGGDLPVERGTVLILETEIDDMSPEIAGYLMERLLDDGALDVQFQPVQMKKNRPGLRVRVLASPERERVLSERIFRETSTFGLRRQTVERWCLARRAEQVETPLGPVAVKVGLWGDRVLKVSPEYESCRALAERHGVALRDVYAMVQTAAAQKYPDLATEKA